MKNPQFLKLKLVASDIEEAGYNKIEIELQKRITIHTSKLVGLNLDSESS